MLLDCEKGMWSLCQAAREGVGGCQGWAVKRWDGLVGGMVVCMLYVEMK